LEWVRFLKEHGVDALRGGQYKGTPDSPYVASSIDDVHFKVKRKESMNPYKALKQAVSDCGVVIPVVAHRRNREDWILIMRADDSIQILIKSMKQW
jgi:3-deoxy-D-arabino-heptulosonate 7-phosphate (DAHP) synthase